jgi:hypothetical protein
LHRRTYWLLNNPSYIFVHYLDKGKLFDSVKTKAQLIEALNLETPSSIQTTKDSEFLFNDYEISSISELGKHPFSFFSDEDLSVGLQSYSGPIELKKSEYNELQMQIKELQGRMNAYEDIFKKVIDTSNPKSPITAHVKPEFFRSFNIEIIDFSPEWDYVSGGAKVLLCISISLEQYFPLITTEGFYFRFDNNDVPATFIQGSVLKCFAPSHKPSFVPIYLIYEGEKIATARMGSKNRLFEYRGLRYDKKKLKAVSFLRAKPDSENDHDLKEYKIRAIESLCSLDMKMNQSNPQPSESLTIDGNEYTIAELRKLSNEQLELLTHAHFMQIARKLFNKLREKFGAKRTALMLNEKDSQGCALIHYIAALNYYEMIELLRSYGAALDIKTDNEHLTPLVISAAKGNKKTLSRLLSFGVREEEKQGNIETKLVNPMKLAVEREYHGILEMLLRDMTLKSAMTNEDSEGSTEVGRLKRQIERSAMPVRNLTPERNTTESTMREGINRSNSNMSIEELNNFVLKIQRNVKEWLLRRHYKDIKQASKVLHSTIEAKMAKKDIDKSAAATMIQRTVRAWLNLKSELINE